MTNALVVERVDRGEKFLDDVFPEWRSAIDLETLDLSDPNHCVIGQTFCHELMRERAEYPEASAWTNGVMAASQYAESHRTGAYAADYPIVEMGFDRDGTGDFEYAELQAEWERRILENV